MQSMKVEKGIIMPRHYPFPEMEVGDSFLLLPDQKRQTAHVAAIRYCAKDGSGKKFSFRKTPEGIRCWRVQ